MYLPTLPRPRNNRRASPARRIPVVRGMGFVVTCPVPTSGTNAAYPHATIRGFRRRAATRMDILPVYGGFRRTLLHRLFTSVIYQCIVPSEGVAWFCTVLYPVPPHRLPQPACHLPLLPPPVGFGLWWWRDWTWAQDYLFQCLLDVTWRHVGEDRNAGSLYCGYGCPNSLLASFLPWCGTRTPAATCGCLLCHRGSSTTPTCCPCATTTTFAPATLRFTACAGPLPGTAAAAHYHLRQPSRTTDTTIILHYLRPLSPAMVGRL